MEGKCEQTYVKTRGIKIWVFFFLEMAYPAPAFPANCANRFN